MKSENRHAQLIQNATLLFSRNGFHGTTTKEIAFAAGVNEALIFRYFVTKEDLYRSVIAEYIERSRRPEWHEEIRRCIADCDDIRLFRKLIGYVIEAYRSDPLMQRLIVFATLEGYYPDADRACHLPKDLLEEIVAYLARRRDEGLLRPIDPLGIFQMVVGMARGFAVGRYVYKLKESRMSDDEAAEMFLQFTVRAVCLDRS